MTIIAVNYDGKDYDVTVSENAFKGNKSLVTVNIAESDVSKFITEQNAFADCTGLATVNIGDRETTFGDRAFSSCTALADVNMADGPCKKEFGELCFSGCTGLTGITIPDSPTTFGNYAFNDLSNLTALTFKEPRNKEYLTEIRGFARTGITSITFPESKVKIMDSNSTEGAFYGCVNLKNITFGEGEIFLENYAFQCSGLGTGTQKSIVIPNVSRIGMGIFLYTSITAVEMSGTATEVETEAFCEIKTLTSVTLPESVTKICSRAFESCSLTKVPNANILEEIGALAFADCTSIGTQDEGKVDLPKTINVGFKAFENCTGIKYIDLPKLQKTSWSMFEGCTSLETVSMPECTEIEMSSFKGCSAMESVQIPKTVTKIKAMAFDGCTKLSNITFAEGSGLQSLGEGYNWGWGKVFDRTAITNITLPGSLNNIEEYAFYGLSGLQSVSFTDENVSRSLEVKVSAFYQTGITSIAFTQNEVKIGSYAFYGCASLSTVTIPNVTSISENAFQGCGGIEEIVFGDRLSSLSEDAFAGAIEFLEKTGGTEIAVSAANMNGFKFVGSDKVLIKKCKLSLHYPGEEEPAIKYYGSDEKPETPEKTPEPADKFQYWAIDDDKDKRFTFGQDAMNGKNIKLYPKYKITVTYKDADEGEDRTVENIVGRELEVSIRFPFESGEIKKDGYTLVGWKIGEKEYAINQAYTFTEDTAVTADWYDRDAVVFVSNGGPLKGSTYVPLIDGKAKLMTAAEVNDYQTCWWYDKDAEYGDRVYCAVGITIKASGTVYLAPEICENWTKINYDFGGGKGDVEENPGAREDQKVMLPTSDDVRYSGHRLIGWSMNGKTIEGSYFEVPRDIWWSDVTVTAIWESVSTVAFRDADGSPLAEEKVIVTGETIRLLNGETVPAQGSAIVGWEAGSSGTVCGLGTDYCVDADVVFTAVRTDAADVLIYVTSGGKMIGDTYSLIEGGSAVSDTRIEKDGFMFLGWLMTDSDGNTAAYANGMHITASGVVRLNAYLVPEGTEVHKVAYDFNEGTGSVTVQEAEEGQLIALQTSLDVRREGYKLAGWEVSPATAVASPYYAVTSEDAVLTAVWESVEPGPSPDPPTSIWDDDDDDPYIPTPAYDSGSSSSSGKANENAVAVAVAAAAAAVTAILAIAVFRRK